MFFIDVLYPILVLRFVISNKGILLKVFNNPDSLVMKCHDLFSCTWVMSGIVCSEKLLISKQFSVLQTFISILIK